MSNSWFVMKTWLSVFVITAIQVTWVKSHSYQLGACPTVEPMSGFDIDKFLGKWYVIQKTSTGSRCLVYNYTKTSEPNLYRIEQVSEHPVLGLIRTNNYHYSGKLTVDSPSVPAKLTVDFPLSVAGKASYIIFATDYDTYAGVFGCQKLAFANRHTAEILSRSKTLDKIYLEKLRSKLSASMVNPFDLSTINQTSCNFDSSATNINIDENTFSGKNIGNVVKKGGEKLGDGVEIVINGAKKIYNKVTGKKEEAMQTQTVSKDREEVIDTTNNRNMDNDAEWI